MRESKGVLHLIKSKNPPVFHTPATVYYRKPPKKGEPFIFHYAGLSFCNLSIVKKISKFDGFIVIQTLNSHYALSTL